MRWNPNPIKLLRASQMNREPSGSYWAGPLLLSLGIDFGVHVVYGLIPGGRGALDFEFPSQWGGEHTRKSTALYGIWGLSVNSLPYDLTIIEKPPAITPLSGGTARAAPMESNPPSRDDGHYSAAPPPLSLLNNESTVEVEGDVTAELQNQP